MSSAAQTIVVIPLHGNNYKQERESIENNFEKTFSAYLNHVIP